MQTRETVEQNGQQDALKVTAAAAVKWYSFLGAEARLNSSDNNFTEVCINIIRAILEC